MVDCLAMLLHASLLAQAGTAGPLVERAVAPTIPFDAVAGGVVIAELSVSPKGVVEGVNAIRTTPPYAAGVLGTVRDWTFKPLTGDKAKEDTLSHVLVVAVFRPNTYPGTPMAQATDEGDPSADVPFPQAMSIPPYPVNGVGSGTVVLEVQVDESGHADDVRTLSGSPAFAEVAESTVRGWDFRPARVEGAVGRSAAYVVIGFREPVTLPAATVSDVPTDAPTTDPTLTTP